MSGVLSGMYITGSAKALNPIPIGTSGLQGWKQPNYWVGGTIIYSPVGMQHNTIAGELDFVGWYGNEPVYTGTLYVQNTNVSIHFWGAVGNGTMNYQGWSGFLTGKSGTCNVSFAVGYGLSPDTFNF